MCKVISTTKLFINLLYVYLKIRFLLSCVKKEKSSTSNLTATSNTPSAKKETKNARQSPRQRQQLVDHTLTLLVVKNGLSLALTTCCRVFFPVKYEIKSISIQINDSKNPKIMRHFSVEKTYFAIIKTDKNISVGFRLSFLTSLFYLFDDIPKFKEMIYDIPEQRGFTYPKTRCKKCFSFVVSPLQVCRHFFRPSNIRTSKRIRPLRRHVEGCTAIRNK